jgi:hypothetical protein
MTTQLSVTSAARLDNPYGIRARYALAGFEFAGDSQFDSADTFHSAHQFILTEYGKHPASTNHPLPVRLDPAWFKHKRFICNIAFANTFR